MAATTVLYCRVTVRFGVQFAAPGKRNAPVFRAHEFVVARVAGSTVSRRFVFSIWAIALPIAGVPPRDTIPR